MAVPKNPSAYGERNVRIVDLGTGETPLGSQATLEVTNPISGRREMERDAKMGSRRGS